MVVPASAWGRSDGGRRPRPSPSSSTSRSPQAQDHRQGDHRRARGVRREVPAPSERSVGHSRRQQQSEPPSSSPTKPRATATRRASSRTKVKARAAPMYGGRGRQEGNHEAERVDHLRRSLRHDRKRRGDAAGCLRRRQRHEHHALLRQGVLEDQDQALDRDHLVRRRRDRPHRLQPLHAGAAGRRQVPRGHGLRHGRHRLPGSLLHLRLPRRRSTAPSRHRSSTT